MSDQELLVSVVIPAFGRTELLRQSVCSALDQDFDANSFEVIVVDSSPEDANVNMLAALEKGSDRRLRILRKHAEGPGPSRNLGVRHARGKFIAFLDSDCIATPAWLSAGLAVFDDDTGIVQGRTLPRPDQRDGVFTRYVVVDAENALYEGANIFFRKACIESIDLDSRDLTPNAERPTGGEDTMLAWQVKRAGWKSRFCATALVYHEILRIGMVDWLIDKRHFMLPGLVRSIPELRSVFFLHYFFDYAHASLSLALIGSALATLHLGYLVLAVPYTALRLLGETQSLRGPLRLLRLGVYLPRDLLSLLSLVAGSVRYRCLLV